MKNTRITRRNFLKLSAFGAGMMALPAAGVAGLAAVAAAPSKVAMAATEEPNFSFLPQPTFNPVSSTTAFNAPIEDISMMWDGSLWSIDSAGAPHLYDPTTNQWNLHGEGIDAVAFDGQLNGTVYVFKGEDYVTANVNTGQTTAPKRIADTWKTLPDSFKYGITGAAGFNGKLYFFKGGWFVQADDASTRTRLIDLQNWPVTGDWKDGLVDAVMGSNDVGLFLFLGTQYIQIDPAVKKVLQSPKPIAPDWSHIPADWITSGFDAGVMFTDYGDYAVFKGPAVRYSFNSVSQYIPTAFLDWPVTWHPQMKHAPSGRAGNMWVIDRHKKEIVRHDGEQWIKVLGDGESVSVGQDGTTMVASSGGLFRWNGSGYDHLIVENLAQVSVGSADHVWVRGADNKVSQLVQTGGNHSLAVRINSATHLAANSDGTVWHCTEGQSNVFRLIPEDTAPSTSIPVKAGLTNSVQRVASTGFGIAHVLVKEIAGANNTTQPLIYRYDSPYIFKTSKSYYVYADNIVFGIGNIYTTCWNNERFDSSTEQRVVALDAHTGHEIARSQPLFTKPTRYELLAFDPVNELIYVGVSRKYNLSTEDRTPGALVALDARTLVEKWSYVLGNRENLEVNGVDAAPVVNGTTLYFGDRYGTLYAFDTVKAAQASNPQPEWTWEVPSIPSIQQSRPHRMTSPIVVNGRVYVADWLVQYKQPDNKIVTGLWLGECNLDGKDPKSTHLGDIQPVNPDQLETAALSEPVIGQVQTTDGTLTPALYFNGYEQIFVHTLDGSTPKKASFSVPSNGEYITTGLAYDDGQRGSSDSDSTPSIWFGGSTGNIYALDPDLKPIHGTPHFAGVGTGINLSVPFTKPVLYVDSNDSVNAFYGLSGTSEVPFLYVYSEGNVAKISTGSTQINAITPVMHGMVYMAGRQPDQNIGTPSQVFGLRVDKLTQGLRDFIIESQMMQDPDENAPGGDLTDASNPIPPSRARYQTHLSIVDDQKNPLPNEAIKIWADAKTTIRVQGYKDPFLVGPGDDEYASVKTGVDGTVVIASGYSKPDGSDTPDMYAPALRVWAPFMNPFERVVVNTDHEFHQRTATAHVNENDDDPDKVNLKKVKSYAGVNGDKPAPLFNDDEMKQGQPENCAKAIGQMNNGVGFGEGGSTNATSALYGKLMLHTGGRRQAHRTLRRNTSAFNIQTPNASLPKYVAYNDLSGIGYFPTNIPVKRHTTVLRSGGLILKNLHDPSVPMNVQTVHHTVAQAAFDDLPPATSNPPWLQSTVAQSGAADAQGVFVINSTSNIFTDFGNWLKRIFAKITDLIITIAEDVWIGIKMIVDGVERVFKAIVKVIDDIAAAVGAFFQALLKIIEDVIAALSVLFHFGEIMWTQRWLADQFSSKVDLVVSNIKSIVQPAIDNAYKNIEETTKEKFDELRKKLQAESGSSGKPINGLNGMGSTPHTMFSAQAGSYGAGASHAPQCSHALQNYKAGMPNASVTSVSSQVIDGVSHLALAESNPFSEFLSDFIGQLKGDPALTDAMNDLQALAKNLLKPSSARDFFSSLLISFIDLIELLVEFTLAVSKALIDTFLKRIEALITSVKTLLTTEIYIPVISWLYEKLFGEKLTLLNLLTFVAAIPVTILFRVIDGVYPQTALSAEDFKVSRADQPVSPAAQKGLMICSGVLSIVQGFTLAFLDSLEEAPSILIKFSGAMGVIIMVMTHPLFFNEGQKVSSYDWLAYVFGFLLAMWSLLPVYFFKGETPAEQEERDQAFSNSLIPLNVSVMLWTILAYIDHGDTDTTANINLAIGIIVSIPGIVNRLKYLGEYALIFVMIADAFCLAAVGALQITIGCLTGSVEGSLPPRRLYFPFVNVDSPYR